MPGFINQKEKIALIPGASRGIGAALSRQWVKRGYRVLGLAQEVCVQLA